MKTCITAALVILNFILRTSSNKVMVFGGGTIDEDNADVWNKIIELAGGKGVARIGVISAGSASPVTTGTKYTALFLQYGVAEAYWIPVRETDPDKAYSQEVVSEVLRMTGFYYTGGNQPRVLGTFLTPDRLDTPVMAAIRSRYEEGIVVAGTSGGALVQPGCITVVAGWSYQALKYGVHRVGDNVGKRDLVYDAQGGLGFIKTHVVDAHFSERGREGRLIRLLADTQGRPLGTPTGFGVDENTALVVRDVDGPDATGEIVGYHGVVFVDTSDARIDRTGTNWQLRIANVHYLTAGDTIDMTTHKVYFGVGKTAIVGGGERRERALTSQDIFLGAAKGERSEFRRVAESLFDSGLDSTTYGATAQSTPTYYVIMTQRAYSEAYRSLDGKISYRSMRVDLVTER